MNDIHTLSKRHRTAAHNKMTHKRLNGFNLRRMSNDDTNLQMTFDINLKQWCWFSRHIVIQDNGEEKKEERMHTLTLI